VELWHLLLDLLVCVIVSSREDKRDRLRAQVGTADQPLISLKAWWMSSRDVLLVSTSSGVAGSGC
jgi:hypothetical protein